MKKGLSIISLAIILNILLFNLNYFSLNLGIQVNAADTVYTATGNTSLQFVNNSGANATVQSEDNKNRWHEYAHYSSSNVTSGIIDGFKKNHVLKPGEKLIVTAYKCEEVKFIISKGSVSVTTISERANYHVEVGKGNSTEFVNNSGNTVYLYNTSSETNTYESAVYPKSVYTLNSSEFGTSYARESINPDAKLVVSADSENVSEIIDFYFAYDLASNLEINQVEGKPNFSIKGTNKFHNISPNKVRIYVNKVEKLELKSGEKIEKTGEISFGAELLKKSIILNDDYPTEVTVYNSVQKEIKKFEPPKLIIDENIDNIENINFLAERAEEIIAQTLRNSNTIDEENQSIIVNKESIDGLEKNMTAVMEQANKAFADLNINLDRELRSTISYKVENSPKKIDVKIEANAANALNADRIRIENDDYFLTFNKDLLEESQGGFDISVEIIEEMEIEFEIDEPEPEILASITPNYINIFAEAKTKKETVKVYKITASKDIDKKGVFSIKTVETGDKKYQAVFRIEEDKKQTGIVSRYNEITGKIDAKDNIRTSAMYFVKENKKSFKDLDSSDAKTKAIIEYLAAMNVVNGSGANKFSPKDKINRAEFSALIMRAISKIEEKESKFDGKFDDVKKNDWFYSAVYSAKYNKIVNGMSENLFSPKDTIRKDQIVAIAARVLRNEMKYKPVAGSEAEKYLNKYYKDKDKIADWSKEDIAVATKYGLVIFRSDGKFVPDENMTRKDAALILEKLFNKVW